MILISLDFGKHSGWKNATTFLSQEQIRTILSGKKRARIFEYVNPIPRLSNLSPMVVCSLSRPCCTHAARSVWRPIHNPSEDFPLAVLDPNTVDEGRDFLTIDKVTPERAVSAHVVRYDPSHRWFWLGHQTSDEVIVFSMWDTHPPEGFSGRMSIPSSIALVELQLIPPYMQ